MISRPDDPYKGVKRTFRIALVVSLLIHPLIIALLQYQFHFRSPQQIAKQKQDRSEIVTVTTAQKRAQKRVARQEPPPRRAEQSATQPKPAPKTARVPDQIARVVPKPVQKPVTVPTYPPPPQKHDLAKLAPGTPEPRPVPTVERVPKQHRTPSPEMPVSKTVAALERPSAAQSEAKPGVRHYSAEELAQISNDLAKTTQSMRGENNPLSNVRRQVSTAEAPKHYAIDFQAENGQTGQGLCEPVKEFDNAGYDYYYMVCNLVEPDGSAARLPLPWPIRYAPRSDPYKVYNGSAEGPIPLPPPGWHPDLSHPMDPVYLGYLREKGYPI